MANNNLIWAFTTNYYYWCSLKTANGTHSAMNQLILKKSIDIFDLIRLDSKPKPKEKIYRNISRSICQVCDYCHSHVFWMKVGHCFGLQFPKWTTKKKHTTISIAHSMYCEHHIELVLFLFLQKKNKIIYFRSLRTIRTDRCTNIELCLYTQFFFVYI